jgi:type II secretory pathway pseudopilin PulG
MVPHSPEQEAAVRNVHGLRVGGSVQASLSGRVRSALLWRLTGLALRLGCAIETPSRAHGYTLLELTVVLALSITMGAVAIPQLFTVVDEMRAAAAARYVATRLQQSRMEAIARSADVGWRFVSGQGGYAYTPFIDGNGNGIRTRDIQDGNDPPIGAVERVADRFAGVDFGILPGLPPIDIGAALPGTDPIKLASSNILTFTALGTSSSGSLYVRGRRQAQYVIRVLGETGRVHVLKFDPGTRTWKPV